MIFMGMFEEAFGEIAEKMTEVLALGTAAIAEALGATASISGDSKIVDHASTIKDETVPVVRKEIRQMFKEFRVELDSQWPKDANVFKRFISDQRFDKGIEIVEKYDFGIPRLTDKVSDEVLATYILLLKNGNQELGKMFNELGDWQAGLPKPPWARSGMDS